MLKAPPYPIFTLSRPPPTLSSPYQRPPLPHPHPINEGGDDEV